MKGIDISNWQKTMNVAAVDADFVIVKASEGIGYTDPSFKKLYSQAKAAGRRLGVYHFARPTSKNDPIKEADWFISVVKDCIGEAILVLDWEAENQHNTTWAKTWMDRVKAVTGAIPLIYMSESVTKKYDWSAIANAGYPLWVAKYKDHDLDYNYDMTNAGAKPKVKHWSGYVMWQWTSSGRLDGYSGNLDCNEFPDVGVKWDVFANTVPHIYTKTVEQVAEEVISGAWGNGDIRKQKLIAAGYDYKAVQAQVNKLLRTKKSIVEIAKEVIAGKWGNGEQRKQALINAGYDYKSVQKQVNTFLNKKTYEDIAEEVIAGKWGNGNNRKKALTAAGYNYDKIQKLVNQILKA